MEQSVKSLKVIGPALVPLVSDTKEVRVYLGRFNHLRRTRSKFKSDLGNVASHYGIRIAKTVMEPLIEMIELMMKGGMAQLQQRRMDLRSIRLVQQGRRRRSS